MKHNFVSGFSVMVIFNLILFIGCKNHTTQVIEETYQDGKTKVVKYYRGTGENQQLVKETQYYPNGNKKVEGSYKNRKKEGKWVFYFENGEEWSIGYFKKGEREGKAKVFHENGKIFYTGTYSRGLKTGTWKFFNNEGTLVNTTTFEKGNPIKQATLTTEKPLKDTLK